VASKISGVDARTGPVGAGRAVERPRDPTTGARTSAEGTDGVHITGTARQLADLEQVLKDMPEVDEVKVAQISDAISGGSYRIVPERIADQLVQVEQALAPFGEKE
jgi:negative regulator of flagellin synthesis FlgM